jgi:chaperonin cofactor prefoldin
MAEGSETPGGEQGFGPESRARAGEGDLLSERRARRAAESGEVALTRRAEAAEATVQTLERHVASLQQRLREVEQERVRMDELLEAERTAALEREHELRRAKQREYAEQQLRIEAEDRLASVDRESREEIERLDARLSASEHDARELAQRLDSLQRQLAEAEQTAAAARAGAEQSLHERLAELERRAREIQAGLEAERAAREHSERLLQSMREGHGRMESLLAEMRGIVARVSTALARERPSSAPGALMYAASEPVHVRSAPARLRVEPPPACPPAWGAPRASTQPAPARAGEMADALAEAVERLRARAEIAPPADAPDEPFAPAPPPAAAPARRPPSHKHSMSLIGRVRMWRKQRRAR